MVKLLKTERSDAGLKMVSDEERIRTYVRGLDPRMEGGIPKKYIVLVCGRAGTMKSSFAYSILYNLARERKKSVYLTLEQSRSSLIDHMRKLGMPLEGAGVPQEVQNLVVLDLSKIRKDVENKEKPVDIDWLHSILTTVKSYKEMFGCEVLVIDSLAALYALTTFRNPRAELFYFFEKLRGLDITAILISEIGQRVGGEVTFGMYGVEDFLADGIVHLDVERVGKRVNLFLSVVKMRKTNHDRSYYPLIFDEKGFEIVVD